MTFLQIHLALVMIIEDRMREAGQDPDAPEEQAEELTTASAIDAFFR